MLLLGVVQYSQDRFCDVTICRVFIMTHTMRVMVRPINRTTITAASPAITVVHVAGAEPKVPVLVCVFVTASRGPEVALWLGTCDDTPLIAVTVISYSPPGLSPV